MERPEIKKWSLLLTVGLILVVGTQGRHDPLRLARLDLESPTLKIPEGDFPLNVRALGPLGGIVERTVSSREELASLKIPSGIIGDKDPNPHTLAILPQPCPRLQRKEGKSVYLGEADRLNHLPMVQLADPDAWEGAQHRSFSEMDGKNILALHRVKISYDYEDSALIDYEGPSPRTGKITQVHEGQSGFYANIHYAVLPFKSEYLQWDSQALLHLAQGRLKEIGKNAWRPEIRTHSFLPGPFLSRSGNLYELCEWGDTAFQAPVQELGYEDIALWDFDYSVKGADHLLLIVFESDEEEEFIRNKLIPPHHMMDDLIGVFEIRKNELSKGLTLKNPRGDFEITVQLGDLPHPPPSLLSRVLLGPIL